MNKKGVLTLILAIVTLTADAQFLFRISGKGLKEPSYILGTIHTLPGSVLLDSIPEYVEAEAKCRQLYSEQDTSDPQLLAKVSNIPQQNMFLPDKQTLVNLLTKEQFDMLKVKVKELLNKNLNPRNNLKPINYVLLFNQAIEAEAMKMYPELSSSGKVDLTRIDAACVDRAIKRGMTIGHLDDHTRIDSLPDMLGLTMEIDAQVDSLVSFLNNYDENRQKILGVWKSVAEMTGYWMKGDFNGFASMEGWDVFMGTNPADVLGRNEKWIPKMKTAMREAPTMFVFGAAHLIGKDGVIAKLREAGYKVKQVK